LCAVAACAHCFALFFAFLWPSFGRSNYFQNVTFFKLDFIFNIPFTLWCCFITMKYVIDTSYFSDSIAFIYFLLFGNYFFGSYLFYNYFENHYGLGIRGKPLNVQFSIFFLVVLYLILNILQRFLSRFLFCVLEIYQCKWLIMD
jgi:hypothetical protein